MTSILEHAARALVAELRSAGDLEPWVEDFEPITPATREVRVDGSIEPIELVRAVLSAIREPSEGMKERGAEDIPWDFYSSPAERKAQAQEVWREMIDAALDNA